MDLLRVCFETHNIDSVIHSAAESHVDRSIKDPFSFARTNVLGTLSYYKLLKTIQIILKINYFIIFDEVYGSLGENGYFTENSSYDPHSPYSASKASSDHF